MIAARLLLATFLPSLVLGFVPVSKPLQLTQLQAVDRRECVGIALAGLFSLSSPSFASNPALETFKGSKKTKGSFIPGKGIRHHEDAILASNPGELTDGW